MNISHCGKGVGTMTREEAIKIIDCYDIGFYDLSGEKIPANKLADAFDMAIEALKAESKHGHWIERAKCEYRCDQCGKIVFADDENELNYCCCCGAKMKRRGL